MWLLIADFNRTTQALLSADFNRTPQQLLIADFNRTTQAFLFADFNRTAQSKADKYPTCHFHRLTVVKVLFCTSHSCCRYFVCLFV